MAFFVQDQADTLWKLHHANPDYETYLSFLQGPLNDFITREIAPRAAANDAEEVFNEDMFRMLGELGFLALSFPEKFGGAEACFSFYNAGLESLAKADAGFALGVGIHGTMTEGIARYGSDELRMQYVPDLISGKRIGAFALSEAGSGSDAKAMKTTWRRDPATGGYILNGTKYWITNGMSADVFFVMARGEDGRISAFVVEKGWKGTFECNKIQDKMGVRSSNTAELIFDNYHVPAGHMVGEEGRGFNYAMLMLNSGRITIASWSVGIAQGALEKLLKYAHEREMFGRLLKDLDNVKRECAEMAVEIAASRALAYDTAFFKSQGRDIIKRAAMAKFKASEMSVRVCERAIQLSGGYGYVQDSRIERHLRDALLARIGEGANEVLSCVVIPRALYKEFEKQEPPPLW